MSNIWNYGQYNLDRDALLKYLQSNLDSYMEYNGYDEDQKNLFRSAISDISTGITNGTITGDGYNKFHDSAGTIEKNNTTANAFGYIHTVANAMGKKFGSVKKEEEKKEETPEQEMFDYNKHGLSYGFNRKYNPFGTDGTYSLWKSGFNTLEDLNNSLLDYIGLHKTAILNSNYDFSKSLIDKDYYINMLSDLENDIRTDGILDSDKSKLKIFGLDPSAFIVTNTKQGLDPFGHIKWNNQPSLKLPEEVPTVPEGFKTVLQLDGSYEIVPENEDVAKLVKSEFGNLSIGEYIRNFKDLGLEESDGYRLTGLFLDVGSIINPEPFTAAGMGYASDYLNYHADELDGINDSWWDDALNVGLSTLGAIPLVGDLGMSGKVAKNLIKTSKSLGKLLLIPGIFAGVTNSEELKQSAYNIINNDFTVNDLRNVWTIILLALGAKNVAKSNKAKTKAEGITNDAEEALVVLLKNNGKTENYQFSGKDKEDLLALKDKPEEFNKYIRENFEGLDKVEAAKINTEKGDLDWKNREHWYSKPKRKEGTKTVVTETKPVYELGKIPRKWDRARYFLDNTNEAIKPTRKLIAEETPKTEEAATLDSQINVSSELNKIEALKQENPKEQSKTTTEEPVKTEEKPDFSKAREAASEKKSESVKATEIEPDNKSKATEAANTKSEVAKYNASNIRKEFDKLKGKGKKKAKLTLKNAKLDKELADLVKQDPSLASKEFNEMLIALQKADKKTTYEQAFKMLTESGYYKEGGIIKAQNGTPLETIIPGWFNYKQKALTGWNRNLRKDKWTTEGVGFHTDADSLLSVYDANTNYTAADNTHVISNDIQNYYNQSNYETITDLINAYNKDANSINDFWNSDHTYNENTGEHAPTFKRLFASRSAGEDGNLNYNLGYLDNLENVMGSTMWHRRMDWYEKPFELLSDIEKQNRIHAVKLKDGSYSYVYKQNNGTIGELNKEEAERILNLEKLTEKPIDDIKLVWDPETLSYMMPEVEVTASKILKNGGQYHIGSKQKQEKVEVPKPEKPNDSFFTPDKALAALNYFRAIGHNKKQLDLANRMVPLIYDPVEHHRYVYGDLGAIAKGLEAAGQIRSLASKPLTSDGSLATAQRLEGENLARQYILLGWQSDNETMRKMSELSWQQEKENRENRYNIAMKNRENMHQVSKEKLMALMGKERSDYESLTNHINEWRTWLTAKQKADSDKANLLYNRRLLNWVQNNPQEYIPNWNLYEGIWNRYNNGETLTANELKTIQQILSRLAEAYYSELYGKGDYFGYGITRAPWETKFAKGGRLTKSLVDTVIKFLKESNNNYNKAVDRSVRGLYNHIKLQRKK